MLVFALHIFREIVPLNGISHRRHDCELVVWIVIELFNSKSRSFIFFEDHVPSSKIQYLIFIYFFSFSFFFFFTTTWLSYCLSAHPLCSGTRFGSLPASFRVTDVQRRRIITAEPDGRSVALSHAWAKRVDATKLSHTD
jgi:hypothetical protein